MDALNLNTLVQAATPRPSTRAVGDSVRPEGGKSLPDSGKPAPVDLPEIDIPEVDIEQAVAQIQDFIAQTERDLQFRVDDATGRTVVSVYGGNGELIRQFPSEEILQIAAALQEQGINLIDQTA